MLLRRETSPFVDLAQERFALATVRLTSGLTHEKEGKVIEASHEGEKMMLSTQAGA